MNKTIRVQRFEKVIDIISNYNIKSIIEFGCGDGKFIPYIKSIHNLIRIAVIDKDKNKIHKIKNTNDDIECYCNSFLEFNKDLNGFDCILAIEVIEHLSNDEIQVFIEIVFGKLKPKLVILTTPNIEYNINYPILFNGLRHNTHLFEFSPSELNDWGKKIVDLFEDYAFYTDFCDINKSSQIIVFTRSEKNEC